jgi:single-stranded-DNA-specific exonuclease
MKAVGWDMAARVSELGIREGTLIDVAYKIRENDHPEYGGIEIQMVGVRLASHAADAGARDIDAGATGG